MPGVKPASRRLYGRQRGHALRPRQQRLLALTLPRLRLSEARAAFPFDAFSRRPEALWLEVGFGSGEHSLAQHASNPDVGLIGCEVFENGICSMLSRLVPDGDEADGALPDMLRLWPDDARALLAALPDRCLDRLFLLFPDPWPKARHAKRRFVHPDTVRLVAAKLRAGGEWRLASDDPTYQGWIGQVMQGQDLFRFEPPQASRPSGWPPTRYEGKALAAGRQPLYWSLIRTGRAAGLETHAGELFGHRP